MLFGQVPVTGGRHGRDGANAIVQHPLVPFVFARSCNGNLVVFAVDEKKKTVDQFWLDVDPNYVRKARAAGRDHDRVEMTVFDRQGYGYECKAQSGSKYVIKMSQFQGRSIIVCPDPKNAAQWKAYTRVKDRMVRLKYIWVQEKKAGSSIFSNLKNIVPEVQYCELHCETMDGKPIIERVTR